MFNARAILASAVLAVSAVWGIASIASDPGVEKISRATPAQVDTFALMSMSHRLPAQKYDAY
jgi:hypothetical protein